MRVALILLAVITLAGCSSSHIVRYSPYDLDRDGVMDAVCTGMEYDPDHYYRYSWRSKGSTECEEQS